MITNPITYLSGYTAMGGENGALGPANLYWDTDTSTTPNLTGTISISGTAVTGVGTALDTELAVGDWIVVNDTTPFLRQIATITSATAATVTEAATSSGDTFRKNNVLFLGKTGKIDWTDSDKYSPIKFSQTGDAEADNVLTGYEAMLEVEIGEFAVSILQKIHYGIAVEKTGLTVDAISRGVSIGTRHSEVAKQMSLVVIEGGKDSTDPLQTVHFYKAAPIIESKVTYDATSQRLIPVKFKIYLDYTKTVNGIPQLWGTDGKTFD